MGVLPPVTSGAEDETEFGPRTGWVQLQPAITNEVFTLAFWVKIRSAPSFKRLVGQESPDGAWFFESYTGNPPEFFIGPHHFNDASPGEQVALTEAVWHHVAIARRREGTSVVWVDGVEALDGQRRHPWPARSRWLLAGSSARGEDAPFVGWVRDLCVFERVLGAGEVHALHAAGVPRRPARNTAARWAATQRAVPIAVSTNLVAAPARAWLHRRFTTEDGLPGNVVKAVLQARNGYLWVGTEDGLARFDGRRFWNFTAQNTPALRAIGQTVWSLSEDADGTIWAGIFGGLLRIRGQEFTAFTNGLPQRFVLQAEPAGDGSVWVAGFNNFVPRGPMWLRRYEPATGTSRAQVVVPGHIRRLIVATNGVWLATEQPELVLFWDGQAAAPAVVAQVDFTAPLIRLTAHPLAEAARLTAWRSETEGAVWWGEVRLAHGAPPFHWLWDSRNARPKVARWSGPAAAEPWPGVSYGLARLREHALERIQLPDFPVATEISCLAANREGGVWFGTEEDGLHLVQERLVHVATTQDGLSGNDVRTVCASPQGDVWAATPEGLCRCQHGAWSPQGWPQRVRTLTCDAQGRLWFGAQGFGPDQLRRDRFVSGANCVLLGLDWQDPNTLRCTRDGTVWIVCERGLTWVKPAGLVQTSDGNWKPDPTSAPPVFGRYSIGKELPRIFPLGLVEDRDGSLWLGSLDGGLVRVSADRVEVFDERDGLPGKHCVPVWLDETGALWITGPAGLTRRAQGKFQTLTEKAGLPHDVLLDLIPDDFGHVWISGKRGIHRVARQELEDYFAGRQEGVRSLTLGPRDGLRTPECSSLHYPSMAKTADGTIWVATRRGLASFDPRRVHLDTRPLPAIIERLVINRRELLLAPPASFPAGASLNHAAWFAGKLPAPAEQKAIRLPPGSGERLEFGFTAISLAAADRVKFRHRLEGYDSAWSPESDLRLAFYTNLKPGAYQFRVQAANAHGLWNEQDTALSFVILPYFWQRGVFWVAVALALATLAVGLHRLRLARQRQLQELRHHQALTNEKARIAADMHDELGATLTQIAILGEVARSQTAAEAQTRLTLERISQAAREATGRMSALVWATNPRHDTLDNLAAYLREHAASRLEDAGLRPQLEFPAELPPQRVSATFRRNLLLVLKESLTNVLKHAAAGEVRVQFAVAGAHVCLRIQDDGRGFDPTRPAGAGGNGLGNLRKRIQDLGGECRIISAPGKGTTLDVCVPLASDSHVCGIAPGHGDRA